MSGLYPWQELAVCETLASLGDNPCLVAPTGGGKTAMAVGLIQALGKKTVFVAHRNEILDQAHARLKKAGIQAGRIQAGEPIYPQFDVQVASKDKLARRPLPWKPELFIVDECFPTGTPVATTMGDVAIERIRAGDLVLSYDEAAQSIVEKSVVRVFKKAATWLVSVRTRTRSVVCTWNHPFLTQSRGWVAAGLLTYDDMVLTIGGHEQQTLSDLRGRLGTTGGRVCEVPAALQAMSVGGGRGTEEDGHQALSRLLRAGEVLRTARSGDGQTGLGLLLRLVQVDSAQGGQFRHDGGHEQEVRFEEDETQESHEEAGGPGEGKDEAPLHGVDASGSRWPREVGSTSTGGHGGGVGVARRGDRPDEAQEVRGPSYPLQPGRRERGADGGGGGRRRESRLLQGEGQGQEEGRFPAFERVEGVQVHEWGGGGGSGGLRKEGLVFNLEVADTHTYIAGSFVVHNCHHSAARTWKKVLQDHPDVPRVGLTATPFRTDRKPLNDLYGKLVVASYFDDLVAEGLLVDPRVKCVGRPDREGLKIHGGEYRSEEVEERMNTDVLVGDCVDTWMRLGKGRRTLLYASGIKHSLHLVERFKAQGIRAEHVDGTTKKGVRRRLIEQLERQEIDILSNVDVFTEGTDIPSVEVAIIERITASLTVHLQIGGRVVRACPGKEGALILDHAGNTEAHGPLNQRLRYSLDGRVEKVEPKTPKVCPTCSLLLPVQMQTECPECGWKAPPLPDAGREIPLEVPGELVDYESLRPEIPFLLRKVYWDEIEKLRISRGYAEGWSWWRYIARFKDKPILAGRRLIDPKTASEDDRYLFWKSLDERRRERGYKPGWAGFQFKAVFGAWPRWRAA